MTQKDEPKPKEDKLGTASLEDLLDAQDQLDEALYEAKQQEDQERVSKIRQAKRKVQQEILSRPNKQAKVEESTSKAQKQWKDLEAAVMDALPEIKQKDSQVYKAAEQFAKENPELMSTLGEVGGLVAIASSIVKLNKGSKQGKSATKDIVKEMEKIVVNKQNPVNYCTQRIKVYHGRDHEG